MKQIWWFNFFCLVYLDSSKLSGGGRNQQYCSFDKPPEKGKVCAVDVRDSWGPCSATNEYGYNHSAPCFVLKLNRVRKIFFLLKLKTIQPSSIPLPTFYLIKHLHSQI